jgi:hypothetical protein
MNSCDYNTEETICTNIVFKSSSLCDTHYKQLIKFDEVTDLIQPEFTDEELRRVNQLEGISEKIGKRFTISDILKFNKKDSGKVRTGFQINIGGIGKKTYFKFSTTNEPKWNLLYSKMLHSIKIWLNLDSIYEIEFDTTQKRPRRNPKEKIVYQKEFWNDLWLHPVFGFEEEGYFITECGRVFSKKTGKFEECAYTPEIYKRVQLYKNGKQKPYKVHRLVAKTFIVNPKPEEYKQVNHLNGDKYDNRKENLEWTNSTGNTNHAYKTGLINKIKDQELHDTVLSTWKRSTLISDLYISEKGQMYNLVKNKIKDPRVSDKGRYYTSNGKKEDGNRYYIDKLVATEYCDRPEPYKVYRYIVHKDLDHNNCCVDNLYWSNKKVKCTIFVVDTRYDDFGPWKCITEFPNHKFSSKGYVWSRKYERILTIKNVNNYVFCDIKYNKEKTQYSLSNLVWCAWNDKSILYLKENKLEVDHIDRNPTNNNLSNLRAVIKTVNGSNRKNTIKLIMQDKDRKEIKMYDCIKDCMNDNIDLKFKYEDIYNSITKGCLHRKLYYFVKQ